MTDNSGDRPPVIEELDNLLVGPAPIHDVIDAGRTVERRRRTILAGVTAVAVLLGGGGLASTQVLGADNPDDPPVADEQTTAPAAHTLAVDASLKPGGQQIHYEEGAQEEIRLEREGPSGPVPVRSHVASAPWSLAWAGLPSGTYTVYAAVRACSGNCGYLEAPTGSCEETFELTDSRTIAVEFEHGASCAVTTSSTPADQELSVTVGPRPGIDPAAVRGTAHWDARNRTVSYLSQSGYSSSCPPDVSATVVDGVVGVVLDPAGQATGACLRDAVSVVATIEGFTEAPASLAVTESGETRSVPVQRVGRPDADDPFGSLDCASSSMYSTDGGYMPRSQPDGFPTREEAVEAWLEASLYTGQDYQVSPSGRSALILRADGTAEANVTFHVHSGYTVRGVVGCSD
ncbi:hypothetical protein [Nocardioides sp. 1609]|uniref:hypothetical protein n=1 Tax=Nocardioides sp. 1609 TaxID=2508327 RepID=UPI00106FD5D1|nr:hypothetical protein [Nocardioides sp. 1609]